MNKGEKVQPQVCVAGLSQQKFSVNDLRVQENCSYELISQLGAGSVTWAKVGSTSYNLESDYGESGFPSRKPEDHYSSIILFTSMTQLQRNYYWRVNSEPIKSGIICTLQKHSKKNFWEKI